MIVIDEIRQLVPDGVYIAEPLAKMTSFKIGGPADLYLEPRDSDQLQGVISYLDQRHAKYIILGNGSNVLISDDGYRGVAINLERGFSEVSVDAQGAIVAGAGIRLSKFVNFCVTNGFAGFEMLAGIPGTLGGAIIMNAGAYGGEISNNIIDVTVIRNGKLVTLEKDACAFRYRDSNLKDSVVVNGRFLVNVGDTESMQKSRRELMEKRNSSQPVQHRNAGSIFKNPEGDFAARLIETAGLKGTAIGTAEVSELHANFIVCKEEGSAGDVIALINHVRHAVYHKHKIVLDLEIQLIGFPESVIAPVV